MFKRIIASAIASIAALLATQTQPRIAASPHYATFPGGRYQFYGRTNGRSRKRKSNRLRISKMTRRKHR